MPDPNQPQNYFEQRIIRELQITEGLNTIISPNFIGTTDKIDPEKPYYEYRVFEPYHEVLQDGSEISGIRINYFTLNGRVASWKKGQNKFAEAFFRVRLSQPIVKKEEGREKVQKYFQKKGSPIMPFFTPSIIEKCRARETIETLVLVEGEIKAFVGHLTGKLNIVGLPSIHGFYDNDHKRSLHLYLQELIITCKVKNLVYLTDADTLVLKYDKDKDLFKRQNSFYRAVKYFRESLELYLQDPKTSLDNIYFMHLQTWLNEEAKGLDDLLLNKKEHQDSIVEDLLQFQFAKTYFSGKIITDSRFANDLNNYFGLTNERVFYNTYREFIGNREFRFRNSRYEFDGEEVKYVRHDDADQYMRIGADWCKIIKVPDKSGNLEEDIVPWKISEIHRDYRKFPDFIDQIRRYDAFISRPNFNGEYKRVHGNCYNIMNPMIHQPKPGSIANTIVFLKHLFRGKGTLEQTADEITEESFLGDPFTIILDYLTLQYRDPEQKLPVPCLVSPEQETGKTTFLSWLRNIYGSNATILDNERFKMNFNAHYISKYVIGLDEGFLDVEKKAEKERLKQLVTSDEVFLENKGINLKKFDYYGKLIICSNDADKLMKMDEHERRWFVVRVPKLPKKDPELKKKLIEEIPAWLYFLQHRTIVHPKETDLWFRTDYILTEQFWKVFEATKTRVEKLVEEYITNLFLTYRMPIIKMPTRFLIKELNELSKYKIDETDLKNYLQDKRGLRPEKPQKVKIPTGFLVRKNEYVIDGITGKPEIDTFTLCCRPYSFVYSSWLKDEDLEEFNDLENWKPLEEDKVDNQHIPF
jgi:hypothetical protein